MPEVPLTWQDFRAMVRLMRALHRLHRQPNYHRLLETELPVVARFDPGHESVMMGYDFHITPQGPRLIEVNTNAGGALLAYRAHFPEPSLDAASSPGLDSPFGPLDAMSRHQKYLLDSFAQEMISFSSGRFRRPNRVVILDEEPEKQFLFGEMQRVRDLFEGWGVSSADIVGPEALRVEPEGVFLAEKVAGKKIQVDLIYNRHCDFYLETPALAGLREAYLAGKVCLTPNPRTYGLLADKRRMVLWSDEKKLRALGVEPRDLLCMHATIPFCQLLAQMDRGQLWSKRKQWVFKPVTAYGSRGVLLGKSISRQRFMALDPNTTLVQHYVPPSLTETSGKDRKMKTDFRLFVYRNKVLGMTARLYHGQITNFRESGSGYAPVRIQNAFRTS